jgi:hypothetical protein
MASDLISIFLIFELLINITSTIAINQFSPFNMVYSRYKLPFKDHNNTLYNFNIVIYKRIKLIRKSRSRIF